MDFRRFGDYASMQGGGGDGPAGAEEAVEAAVARAVVKAQEVVTGMLRE